MAFEAAKCTSCGANIKLDGYRAAVNCPYCNTVYIVDKRHSDNQQLRRSASAPTSASSPIQGQTIINNYQVPPPPYPRPKINYFLMFFLFCFYFFPGMIYLSNIKAKQKHWDEMYYR